MDIKIFKSGLKNFNKLDLSSILDSFNNSKIIFMKKILTTFAVLAMCSGAAYAQDAASGTEKKPMTAQERQQKREAWMKNMTPEQKKHMEERRKKFEALSPEKKKELKAEMKRHRDEVERITGEKMPKHPHHPGMEEMDK